MSRNISDEKFWKCYLALEPTPSELVLVLCHQTLKRQVWDLIWPNLKELHLTELVICLEACKTLEPEIRDRFAEWLLVECPRPLTQAILYRIIFLSEEWQLAAWWRLKKSGLGLDILTDILIGLGRKPDNEGNASTVAKEVWRQIRRWSVGPEKTKALARIAGSGSSYWLKAWKCCRNDPRWTELSWCTLAWIHRNLKRARLDHERKIVEREIIFHPEVRIDELERLDSITDVEKERQELIRRRTEIANLFRRLGYNFNAF